MARVINWNDPLTTVPCGYRILPNTHGTGLAVLPCTEASMFDTVIKAMGVHPANHIDVAMTLLVAILIANFAGILIHALSERSSFGPFINGGLLLALAFIGIYAFVTLSPAMALANKQAAISAGVALASLGFLALSFAKSTVTR